jgi:hypothetical protein
MSNAKMMIPHMPAPEILRAVGAITLRHSFLDQMLRMTIKRLAGITPEEADLATAFQGSAVLRERISKIARRTLGEGTALLLLQALLERARLATEKRNTFVHSLWAQELDGEPMMRGSDREWKPLPTAAELETLSLEIERIAEELNIARREGFFSGAYNRSKEAGQVMTATGSGRPILLLFIE